MGIGDEVIVTGQCRELQEKDPRKVRIVYEKRGRWFDVWDNNPRIARHEEVGDFQEFHPRDRWLRPYCVEKTPERWTWRAWKPPRGEFYFTPAELAFGAAHVGRVVIQPQIKHGAPLGKQWGEDRWRVLALHLLDAGVTPTIIGQDIRTHWQRVEEIPTRSIRLAAAVLSTARLAIVPEGALHHVCAAVGTPAVVIYGGYISPEVIGYEGQVALFTGSGLGCGRRGRCSHCEGAMSRIQPADVAAQALRILKNV